MGALRHLNLTVSGLERSMAFYGRWFGFDRVLARYPDGTIFVTNGDGFELALHAGPPAPDRRWHFGFTFRSRDEVLELADRLADAGIELVAGTTHPSTWASSARTPTATGSRRTTSRARDGHPPLRSCPPPPREPRAGDE